MTTSPPGSALEQKLRALVDEQALSPEQATQLWQAAQQDHEVPAEPTPSTGARPRSTTGVLDVLGYVGGALLLGAVIFVGATLWDDLGRGAKIALAIASFLVPLAGGLVLELSRTRRGLARALLALACLAAGFACYTIMDGRSTEVPSGIAVVAAVIGGITLRSAVFYAPGWVAIMIFVPAFIDTWLDFGNPDDAGYAMAAGFLLVALVLVLCGLLLRRHVAWTLAGVSAWVASMVLMALEESYLAVGLATVVAAALFVGVVRLQMYALAVVGCLLVLSIWPWALYQILDSALGVAVGLVAAGCVLIAAAVVLTRLRRRAAVSA